MVVVRAVLGIGDADVHVEAAGQELDPLDRETNHALRLDRHGDAIDKRVRTEDPNPVVAVEVHAEHRVAHTFRVAVTNLDTGRLTRFEDHAFRSIRPEDARACDLDLLRAPARADLAARGALALLFLPHLLVVRVDDVVRRALRTDAPLIEPERALAEARDRAEVVRDEHDRLLRGAELADLGEALVLEVLVADREHLVDQEDVRFEVHGDREAEAHVHAARVRLHGGVKEAADVGELLDRRHRPVHLLARESEKRAVEISVLAAAEVRVETGADLEQRGHAAIHLERAARRLRRPREELEERRFA